MSLKKILIMIAVFSAVILPGWTVFGQVGLELKYLPPCVGNDCQSVSGGHISEYIVRFYQFGVGFAGILAVGMIAAGAIYKSINPGNPGKQKEGEEMMKSAIWGIVLLLGSYLILKTVNPALVRLGEPDLPEIPAQEFKSFVEIPGEETESGVIGEDAPQYEGLKDYCLSNYADLRPDCLTKGAEILRCVPELGGTCSLLDRSLPMKPDQCRWQQSANVPSECWVQPQVNANLARLQNMLSRGYNVNAFHITEAFPPVVKHRSNGHYNGCSVDIAVVTQPPGKCATVDTIVEFARVAGFRPWNEYNECNGTSSELATDDHIHLTALNCP